MILRHSCGNFVCDLGKLSETERKLIDDGTITLRCMKCFTPIKLYSRLATDSGHVWLEEYGMWCEKDKVEQFKKDYERYQRESK